MRFKNVEQPFKMNPIVVANKWAIYGKRADNPEERGEFIENCKLFDDEPQALNYLAGLPDSDNYSVMEVCVCLPPGEVQKKPMTFDEFFKEAERTGLTLKGFLPGLVENLEKMERDGEIRKHADGGHEYVTP